jgi:hypothetical protein
MSGKASPLPCHHLGLNRQWLPPTVTFYYHCRHFYPYPNPLISYPRHHRLVAHLPPQSCHVTVAPTTTTGSLTYRPPSLLGEDLLYILHLNCNLTRALVEVGDHNSSVINGGGTKIGQAKPPNHSTFN